MTIIEVFFCFVRIHDCNQIAWKNNITRKLDLESIALIEVFSDEFGIWANA